MILQEALQAQVQVLDVFLRSDDPDLADLRRACDAAGARTVDVGENVLRSLAATASPQGIVAVAAIPRFELTDLPEGADLVLVLAQVRDPGNAGALVRSAAAAGAGCVVFTEGSVDPFGPKTVRASAGAMFKIPVARSIGIARAVEMLRERGFTVVGADSSAGITLYDVDLVRPTAIVLGNESWGLGAELRPDLSASVPLDPAVESLNVATAGTLFLFEAVRQRRLSSACDG